MKKHTSPLSPQLGTLILLIASISLSLACGGGGGGGGSTSGDAPAQNLSIRLKPGDFLPVEEDSTFTLYELGNPANTLADKIELKGADSQGVDVDLKTDTSYVVVMTVKGMPFLRTTIMASQIAAAKESGLLDIGAINSVTTYLTGLLELKLNQGRFKTLRQKDTEVQSLLSENFGSSVTEFGKLYYANFTNGTISETPNFRLRKNRINLLRLYFNRVRSITRPSDIKKAEAMLKLYDTLFDEENPVNLIAALSSPDLPQPGGSAPADGGLSVIQNLQSRGAFLQGEGVLSIAELRGVFFEPKAHAALAIKAFSNPTGKLDGQIAGMATKEISVELIGDGTNTPNVKTTTDAQGKYTFTGLLPGNYKLKPTHTGYVFDPPSRDIVLQKNAALNGFQFTSIANRGQVSVTPSSNAQSLSEGYYQSINVAGNANLLASNIVSGVDIFGVVGTANATSGANVVDTSAGTATAADILAGKSAYVGGQLVTGTVTTQTPSHLSSTLSAGYYQATNLALIDGDLTSANIRKGKTIFGISGNANLLIHSSKHSGGNITIKHK